MAKPCPLEQVANSVEKSLKKMQPDFERWKQLWEKII